MRYLTISVLLIILILIVILMNSKIEYFDNPEKSTTSEIGEGASELYGWGFDGIKDNDDKKPDKKCPRCDHQYISDKTCNIVIDERHGCRYCDITKNKDIDKYVLKSSIPPCPDMSQYAKKSMVQTCPDMNNYMLKSELPEYCAAYWPDKDRYMLKSQCQPDNKYKVVYEDISKHPDYDKYISKDNCKKYKKSWTQDFEDWWDNITGKNKSTKPRKESFPRGYSYSPYAGYGTDNTGYALDGGQVREKHFYEKEGL